MIQLVLQIEMYYIKKQRRLLPDSYLWSGILFAKKCGKSQIVTFYNTHFIFFSLPIFLRGREKEKGQ